METPEIPTPVDSSQTARCCLCRKGHQPCLSCKCSRDDKPCTNCLPGSRCHNPNVRANESTKLLVNDETYNFKWGLHEGSDIAPQIFNAYDQIVHWRRNIFMPPTGNTTKTMMQEMLKLMKSWNDHTELGKIAMHALMIMPALLMQKPFAKSKSRDHVAALKRRLEMWQEGDFVTLLREGITIQKRLASSRSKASGQQNRRRFSVLMREGKVNQATRLLSNKNSSSGILDLNEDTMNEIKEKHPKGKDADPEALLSGPVDQLVHSVVFDEIDAVSIREASQRTSGAAGPSGLDAFAWKKLLCNNKMYGAVSDDMCHELAKMTRQLCTKECDNMEALMACRLVPLDKNPGLRPIGIGEVLRRIIGKTIMVCLKEDIGEAAGNLQMCAGKPAGAEAAIHALREMFDQDDAEAVLMVDAANAFNLINRKALLHNIQITCPSISTFTQNCYSHASRVFVSGGKEISSDEGITQGDACAMGLYSLGLAPLQQELAFTCRPNRCNGLPAELKFTKQVAFADDVNAVGTVPSMKNYWDHISEDGPKYGYHPKASKSWIIVKPEHEASAEQLFSDSEVKVTTSGQKHLGAALGSELYKKQYMEEKVKDWVDQLENLAKMAKTDPQAALSAFTHGVRHTWTYTMRTISGIAELLEPLEECISNTLIPSIVGKQCNATERKLLSLPPRLGGLGIIDPTENCQTEYMNSKSLTTQLQNFIHDQSIGGQLDQESLNKQKYQISKTRQDYQQSKLEEVKAELENNPLKLRLLESSCERGASNWLTCLPLESDGFGLNKQEFADAIRLRYGWNLERMPVKCPCGAVFSVQHAMSCKKGGFVHARHNEVRDLTASLLKEVCHDVAVEPLLQPLTGEQFRYKTAITSPEARLDVSVRSFWTKGQRTFCDVRVFDPTTPRLLSKPLEAAYAEQEQEKRRGYAQRVLHIEHGSFTPLVFSIYGGMSVECKRFYARLSLLLSNKRNENLSTTVSWLRCRLSFSLLRSALLCMRGSRCTTPQTDIQETTIPFVVKEAQLH